jgi:histidyl-tRNA synthetase
MRNGEHLSTDPYKGVRDFYPEDMAVLRYIFDVWSETAESFGFERYDASILEPSDLYKAKGAENEEMVNEQTYTFTDRGGREVTLRPEMTPTVARMIAAKKRELSFPVRWYSIPNLFRYERPQKGRLREHYQLNCDLFGIDHIAADIEMIALAHQMFLNFGADESMFEIRINDRREMLALYGSIGITDSGVIGDLTRLNDRRAKMPAEEYRKALTELVGDEHAAHVITLLDSQEDSGNEVIEGLRLLGIGNARIDRSLSRGFDYYTGTIFEIFDTSGENNRSLLGGGRYDNLTALFGDEAVTGIGFGMGDVTMRDFLETHDLLSFGITAPDLLIIPTDAAHFIEAERIGASFRAADISCAVDLSQRKIGKMISDAADRFVSYVLILGEDEIAQGSYTLKNLETSEEISGTLEDLIGKFPSS